MLFFLDAFELLFLAGPLVDYIALAVGYSNKEVQTAACYIWVHLYSAATSCNVPAKLTHQLSHNVLEILITTRCSELLLNALGNTSQRPLFLHVSLALKVYP